MAYAIELLLQFCVVNYFRKLAPLFSTFGNIEKNLPQLSRNLLIHLLFEHPSKSVWFWWKKPKFINLVFLFFLFVKVVGYKGKLRRGPTKAFLRSLKYGDWLDDGLILMMFSVRLPKVELWCCTFSFYPQHRAVNHAQFEINCAITFMSISRLTENGS